MQPKTAMIDRSVVVNGVWNVTGWLLPICFFLLVTPYLINRLGVEAFGIFALVQAVIGYTGLLNIGFSDAITRGVAQARHGDSNVAMKVRWAGLFVFTAVAITGGLLILALSSFFARRLFNIPTEMENAAVDCFRIGALLFFTQILSEFIRGCAFGYSRFDIPNISRVLGYLVAIVFVYVLVANGFGIVGAMAALATGAILSLVISGVWLQISVPMRAFKGELRGVFIEIGTFSAHVFLARVASITANRLGQIGVASFGALANVAYLDVPMRLGEAGSALANKTVQVLYPELSEAARTRRLEEMAVPLVTMLQLEMFVGVPLILFLTLEGEWLFRLWIDAEFAAETGMIVPLLGVSFLLSVLSQVPSYLAMAIGKPQIIARYSMFRLGLFAIAGYPLITSYGLVGVAITHMAAAIVVDPPFIYRVLQKAFKINIYWELRRTLICHGALFAGAYAIYKYAVVGAGYDHPAISLVVVLAYVIAGMLFGALPRDAWSRIMRGNAQVHSAQ